MKAKWRVFDELRKNGAATSYELAAELEMPHKSVSAHLSDLVAEGYVMRGKKMYDEGKRGPRFCLYEASA